ncbi:nuclear transport factor 2 family protein [Novosphingobium malaysiense]|uniref:nuclear transport factor 2 family protein n=1 Tax=Novosphingobium malaysiense TaxID=1348853 RepID=UPI00069110BE|nr:nuclear transport factor 2 family protein [Novosphingobium malaysiense]
MTSTGQTEDIVALNQLAFRYAAAIDACDIPALQALFLPDARLRSFHPNAEQPFADLSGHEQLAEIPRAMRGAYADTTHMMTNYLFEVSGDRAKGEVLCTARHLLADRSASLNVVIRYHDTYAREGDAWFIATRDIRFLWSEKHAVQDDLMGGTNR